DEVVARLAETAPAQRVGFTLEARRDMFRIEGGSFVDSGGEPFANVADMPVSAPHDRANALAAAAAAFAAGATRDRVERALREYPRLHHRPARPTGRRRTALAGVRVLRLVPELLGARQRLRA